MHATDTIAFKCPITRNNGSYPSPRTQSRLTDFQAVTRFWIARRHQSSGSWVRDLGNLIGCGRLWSARRWSQLGKSQSVLFRQSISTREGICYALKYLASNTNILVSKRLPGWRMNC